MSGATLSLITALGLYDSLIDDPRRLQNVDKERFELLMSPGPWTTIDRSDVRVAFDAILFGTLDSMGLPRFTLPCEYVAAAIAKFVSPVNVMTMCSWSEHHGTSADDMSVAQSSTIIEPVTARQLFAFVSMVLAASPGTVSSRYDCAVRNALSEVFLRDLVLLTEPTEEKEDVKEKSPLYAKSEKSSRKA